MNKTIFLIRHSKAIWYNDKFENLQLQNEKGVLSIEGEKFAESKLINDELTNLDLIVSSNYVRAISTAKYLTVKNEKEILILPNFAERKFGVNSWDDLPKDFEIKQWKDNNYKTSNGESLNEVRERCFNELTNLLSRDYKRIAIVFHATAMLSLLKTWCDIKFTDDDKIEITFNNKTIKLDRIENCIIFKLEFQNDELKNIEIV